jgi:hypothetical protein
MNMKNEKKFYSENTEVKRSVGDRRSWGDNIKMDLR